MNGIIYDEKHLNKQYRTRIMKTSPYSKLKAVPGVLLLIIVSCNAFSQQITYNPHNPKSGFTINANVTATKGETNKDCFFDIEVDQKWTVTLSPGEDGNINDIPHGIYFEFVGATIINVAINNNYILYPGNTWLQSASQSPLNPLGSNYVYWNKKPIGTCVMPTNAIPTNQLESIRIYVNPTSNNITVNVRGLKGGSWPNNWFSGTIPMPATNNDWNNGPYNNYFNWLISQTFACPDAYNIGPDDEVCANTLMALSISPTPPPVASVEWYYSTEASCPGTNPPTGWITPAYQGNTFNAGFMTAPHYCFIAVIKTGCCTSYSNVRQISVCAGPPEGTFTAHPGLSSADLQDLNNNNEWHACQNWQGVLSLDPLIPTCQTIIRWSKRERYNDNPWPTNFSGITGTGRLTSINIGPLTNNGMCSRSIEYRAKMQNTCGTTDAYFTIVIDGLPDGGTITTLTNGSCDTGIGGTQVAPIVCVETRLIHQTRCGKPDHWEYCEETALCSNIYGQWFDIDKSTGTNEWWTSPEKLTKTTKFRVWVVNGACNVNPPPDPSNGIYSPEITVTVIPDPTVSIATDTYFICLGSIPTLTATANLPTVCIPNVPVSYQWFKGMNPIPGANSPTYHPTGPGRYHVVFTSSQCNKVAVSNIIPICKPLLEILGPCCICMDANGIGETVVIIANIRNIEPCIGLCDFTYQWYFNGNIMAGETGQQITINQQGTYSVTASCGSCLLDTAPFNLVKCIGHHSK